MHRLIWALKQGNKELIKKAEEDMDKDTDRIVFDLFVGFRWYRKWKGGHWEKWFTPDTGQIWCHVERCYKDYKGCRRPAHWCRGTPICEDYSEED